jgi:hypothetical protein
LQKLSIFYYLRLHEGKEQSGSPPGSAMSSCILSRNRPALEHGGQVSSANGGRVQTKDDGGVAGHGFVQNQRSHGFLCISKEIK